MAGVFRGALPAGEAVALVDCAARAPAGRSFGWLDARAARLAALLASAAPPGAVVVLLSAASPEAVAGILAIWRAGGIYLPVDVDWPHDRIRFVMQDAAPEVILAERRAMNEAKRHLESASVVSLESGDIEHKRPGNSASQATFLRLRAPDTAAMCAYIMYTSGSTGMPKGVLGSRQGLIARCEWMWSRYPFGDQEVCAQKTALTFVDSLWEIFGPLAQRVPLLMIPPSSKLQPLELSMMLARWSVTRLVVVPTLLRVLLDSLESAGRPSAPGDVGLEEEARDLSTPLLPSLKHLSVSGDALPIRLCERCIRLLPGVVIHNLYGSTEVSADVTCFDFTAHSQPYEGVPEGRALRCPAICPLGQPIAGVAVRLIDHDALLSGEEGCRFAVGEGRVGEIAVSGDCVCLGYLNREEFSASRFVHQDGRAWFLTGDLGEYDSNGDLRFAGRRDLQLKINGWRVEPREVEAVFEAESELCTVVVLPWVEESADELPTSSGTQLALCGCLRPSNSTAVSAFATTAVTDSTAPSGVGGLELLLEESLKIAPRLRLKAEMALPPVMRPSFYLIVRDVPRLTSGKLDRLAMEKALPTLLSQFAHGITGLPGDEEGGIVSINESWVDGAGDEAGKALGEEMHRLLLPRTLGGRSLLKDVTFVQAGGTSVLAARLSAALRARGWLLHPEVLLRPDGCLRVLSGQMRRLEIVAENKPQAYETPVLAGARSSFSGWLQATGAASKKRPSTLHEEGMQSDDGSMRAQCSGNIFPDGRASGGFSSVDTADADQTERHVYPPFGPLVMNQLQVVEHSSVALTDSNTPVGPPLAFVWATGRASYALFCNPPTPPSRSSTPPLPTELPASVRLHVAWSVDMGKCVDASPLLACYASPDGRRLIRAFVGSHAGRLAAIDVASGSELWNSTLPDRLEASCALSSDGAVVFCGCYDHHLYALSAIDGAQLWSYRADGMVKASVCVIPTLKGDVVFGGCFGGSLFALPAGSGVRLWLGACQGPLFASPRADFARRQLYCADLRGCVQCFAYEDPCTGFDIKWQYTTTPRQPPYPGSEPIFSSPVICTTTGNVCFGCTDFQLHCISPGGEVFVLLWTFNAGAPIFSAPATAMGLTRSEREHAAASSDTREEVYGQGDVVVVGRDGRELEVHQQLEEQLYFTSQLGQLFCVRASNGAMLWHQPAQVHGHSSPAVDTAIGQGYTVSACHDYVAHMVCVGGVDGSVNAFSCSDGRLLAVHKLAGAVFSSPVICASRVVVGCRDDRLYCLEIHSQKIHRLSMRDAMPSSDQEAFSDGKSEVEVEKPLDAKLTQKVEALRRLLGR